MPISEVHLIDCMEFMATVPDGFFSLALVDPPYGIDNQRSGGRGIGSGWKRHVVKDWDYNIPDKLYFDELFRVSKNQIIWGANYFTQYLPGSMGWIVWDKKQDAFSTSDSELAFSSFKCKLRNFRFAPGAERGCMAYLGNIHPTQKPVKLYKWLLRNYAKEGDKIFDSHMGSQSSRIACWDGGFDFWDCELDPDYFKDGCKRFENHIKQLKLL